MGIDDLAAELARARALEIDDLADAVQELGFECTRCGACCRGSDGEHTATVFPDEIRAMQDDEYGWRDVARPVPFGLRQGDDGPEGETFERSLQIDGCGDCAFYGETNGIGTCAVYGKRPLICQT